MTGFTCTLFRICPNAMLNVLIMHVFSPPNFCSSQFVTNFMLDWWKKDQDPLEETRATQTTTASSTPRARRVSDHQCDRSLAELCHLFTLRGSCSTHHRGLIGSEFQTGNSSITLQK